MPKIKPPEICTGELSVTAKFHPVGPLACWAVQLGFSVYSCFPSASHHTSVYQKLRVKQRIQQDLAPKRETHLEIVPSFPSFSLVLSTFLGYVNYPIISPHHSRCGATSWVDSDSFSCSSSSAMVASRRTRSSPGEPGSPCRWTRQGQTSGILARQLEAKSPTISKPQPAGCHGEIPVDQMEKR